MTGLRRYLGKTYCFSALQPLILNDSIADFTGGTFWQKSGFSTENPLRAHFAVSSDRYSRKASLRK
jgi:hypothetical protein